jgi:hypothetical protein
MVVCRVLDCGGLGMMNESQYTKMQGFEIAMV